MCGVCFFFEGYGSHRDLHGLTHSFPTRRSSDLSRRPLARIDDAIGAARAVARGRDRLEHVVEAAADLRTAGAEGAARIGAAELVAQRGEADRKSTRLNSSH